jgi:hypothetical protein
MPALGRADARRDDEDRREGGRILGGAPTEVEDRRRRASSLLGQARHHAELARVALVARPRDGEPDREELLVELLANALAQALEQTAVTGGGRQLELELECLDAEAGRRAFEDGMSGLGHCGQGPLSGSAWHRGGYGKAAG